MSDIQMKKIVMLWQSIPICGLITLRSLAENPNFTIISTSDTPLSFDELSLFGSQLQIVNDFSDIDTDALISNYDYFILPGWSNNSILQIAKKAKKNQKITIVSSDNNKKNNFRQFLGAIYFRIKFKKLFDIAFVPGKSGRVLMNMFGFKDDKIIENLYGAYEQIFNSQIPFINRENEFLFVGQLIKRKSFDQLIEGYTHYLTLGGSWSLRIIGAGELASIIPNHLMIRYEGRQVATNVAAFMNNAKAFILLSREEHWGTVVCEAAACGLPLILSEHIGSLLDLFVNNGLIVRSLDPISIATTLIEFENQSLEIHLAQSKKSIEYGAKYNSQGFMRSIMELSNQMVNEL